MATEEESSEGYTILEHTADVGVRAWGPTPESAFSMAAFGMFEIILDIDPRGWHGEGTEAAIQADARAATWDDLLVNWLAELVYLFDVEGIVPRRIDFTQCEPENCSATLTGSLMSDPAATEGTAIKAVTYHQLQLQITPTRTELQVIFDI
jgi:SHS2 domain-containing protein